MQFTTEIRRLLFGLLLALGAVGAVSAYWSITGSLTIEPRPDNPRRIEQETAIDRGSLNDRNGQPLVISTLVGNGTARIREYLYPATHGTLGYYSINYGTNGAEAAYDDLLSGTDRNDDLGTWFEYDVLHRTVEGTDVQLTLDLSVQQTLDEAMNGIEGAAVVLSVPDGGVIAMISRPSYDPNLLDAEWEMLQNDPDEPFFNRALQGRYQPGGITQLPLLLTALLAQVPLDTVYDSATMPVRAGEVIQVCVASPPAEQLTTLADAFVYSCPGPFATLIDAVGVERVAATFDLFRFDIPRTLPGFITPLQIEAENEDEPATPEATLTPLNFSQDDALGQGNLIVTPLQMAAAVAAIINGGNAPAPYMLRATRPPQATTWQPITRLRDTTPITTPETALQVQGVMRRTVQQGAATAAQRDGYDIGGQVGLAYAGDETQAWFIGWVRTASREGMAVAVLLENSDDLDQAAFIGAEALVAAVTGTR